LEPKVLARKPEQSGFFVSAGWQEYRVTRHAGITVNAIARVRHTGIWNFSFPHKNNSRILPGLF
jgi:hypothetical protein